MTVRMIMTRLRRRLTRKTLVSVLVQLAVALAGLAIAYSNYLFFHSLAELFTVIIAAVIFLFVWNSRDFITDRYVLFLGIAYLFVGGIDLVHVLSFKGMQVLTWSATADAATRLWILARALEVASLLAAVKLGSNFREGRLLFGYLVFTILGLLSIRYGIFPVCYQEGVGLTPFKIVSEYVITVGLFAALVLYWRERRRFDPSVFEYLILSVVFMMVSEISFTLYEELFSAWNAVGHILKVFSFFYLYRAVLQTAIHRPHVLLYRSLKRREEQLRDVNAELEEYAHTVAHDFKGPLTSIGLSAEMMTRTLSRRPLGDRDLELLERLAKQVSDGARSSAQFVSEVLALAEAGQKPQVLGAVPVGEVIEKILSERAGVLATRKITVHWDKGRLGSVFGSRVQIYQLFLNLIDNAIKHASAASPEIHIRYREGSKPGEHHYEVQDNGPGIDPEIIDKIFLPFFKANSTGHGLGLATVQKIARAYGGAVSVTNRDGACFEVILHDFSA